MEICCFPQSISTYFCFATFFEFYKLSISIILSPYHSYLLIPFLTLLIYSLNGYFKDIKICKGSGRIKIRRKGEDGEVEKRRVN
ncbi:MAG: hypothetical protein AB1414_09085 [bacterium]